MNYPPVPEAVQERDELLELSEVSLISHDRDAAIAHLDPDGQDYSSDSDQETGKTLDRGRKALLCGGLLCAALVLFAIVAGMLGVGKSSSNGGWEAEGAWGDPTEEFAALGDGLCMDTHGQLLRHFNASGDALQLFEPARIGLDGFSDECKTRCAALPSCTGFATFLGALPSGQRGGCSLVMEDSGYPAAGDGNSSFRCFWRHRFKFNSAGIYKPPRPSVPKKIWSFWQAANQAPSNHTVATKEFLALCQKSWRKLNPGWQVNILNEDSVWQYISRSDLSAGFDALSAQHRSDAVRLAVLVKHGGVWLDASTLLLQPLVRLLGEDPSLRTFFVELGLANQPTVARRFSEKRYSAAFRVESWFLAAPPQDPLLVRTNNCVKKFHADTDRKDLKDYPEIFSQRQLDDLDALGIWSSLSTEACMFKVLDEDLALYRWWQSPKIHRINALGHINPVWFTKPNLAFTELFRRVSPEMVNVLTGGAMHLLKLTSGMREALVSPLTPKELYGCVDSSWSITLTAIGIFNATKCLQLDSPGANRWL